MSKSRASISAIVDFTVVIILCFGWFILVSINAVASGFPAGKFDDSAFMGIVIYELILGAVALAFLYCRGQSLRPLIPAPNAKGCLIGLALYFVAALATWPIALLAGADGMAAQPIDQMTSGAAISLPALVCVSIVNGLYEETFLTGYLLPALESSGAIFALGASLLVRISYHLYQGPVGVISVLVVGAVFGAYFWRTGKLWPVVFAHMFADFTGFAFA